MLSPRPRHKTIGSLFSLTATLTSPNCGLLKIWILLIALFLLILRPRSHRSDAPRLSWAMLIGNSFFVPYGVSALRGCTLSVSGLITLRPIAALGRRVRPHSVYQPRLFPSCQCANLVNGVGLEPTTTGFSQPASIHLRLSTRPLVQPFSAADVPLKLVPKALYLLAGEHHLAAL